MGVAWHPGQLLFVGYPGPEIPPPLAKRIATGQVGGVVLFSRNVVADGLAATVESLHALAPEGAPLVVGIDQEGGRVQRLRAPWTVWPPMRRLGEIDDPATTRRVAAAMARELADVGINLNFAPVVDVDSNPANPVIGDRSFGRDPARVSRHAVAIIEGLQERRVAACAKHFPGHGDTSIDSHLALPCLDHELERLELVELPPFRAAIEAGVASVMMAHVLFPRLDRKRPATLSPGIVELLREHLHFDKLVFTDDLEMRGVADGFSVRERTLCPLEAGVDVLLVCSQMDLWEEMLRILERAPDATVERALARMQVFKQRFGGMPVAGGAPPYPDHLEFADRLG